MPRKAINPFVGTGKYRGKPLYLDGNTVRRMLDAGRADGDVSGKPYFHRTFAAISALSQLYDTLEGVKQNRPVEMTPEEHALTFRAHAQRAGDSGRKAVIAVATDLAEKASQLRKTARDKSGLNTRFEEGRAGRILDRLNAMPERARAKALDDAFKRDDLLVISAVMNAHPLELGNVKLPLSYAVDDYIRSKAPEEMADADALDLAGTELEAVWGGFSKSIEAMRDTTSEENGDRLADAAKQSEAAFGRALNEASMT